MIYLTAQNVRKSYGSAHVLKGVSLELREREILALLGPNGAGKTTFIKILATLLTKDGGDIRLLGHDLVADEREVRHLFGYVGQDTDRSAYGRLTVRENLRFFGALHGLSRTEIDRQIDKLAGYFDFQTTLDKQFNFLSGGQKQTTVIMRALLYDPPVIYLDEPTKGLDPLVAKHIRTFLVQYVDEERKALLLTSHILSEVDLMANRVALIHDGTIPITATPQELKRSLSAETFVELPQADLTAAAREAILALPFVHGSRESDAEWIGFGVTDNLAGTEAIIQVLRSQSIRTQLRHRTVSLEDAFIHHIGVLSDTFEH